MHTEYFIGLILFLIPLTLSPGPNNILLANSGARFGFKKTIPHILGIELGILLLIALGAVGLNMIYAKNPWLPLALKGIGTLYLIYMASKMLLAKGNIKQKVEEGRPFRFYEAALFQFTNPKALLIVTSMLSGFSLPGENYGFSVLILLAMVPLIGVPCVSVWAAFGSKMQGLIQTDQRLKNFNRVMAVLTLSAASMIWV